MGVRLHQLVVALLADWWRRQWHNVAVGAGWLAVLTTLLALFAHLPFGGGLR